MQNSSQQISQSQPDLSAENLSLRNRIAQLEGDQRDILQELQDTIKQRDWAMIFAHYLQTHLEHVECSASYVDELLRHHRSRILQSFERFMHSDIMDPELGLVRFTHPPICPES